MTPAAFDPDSVQAKLRLMRQLLDDLDAASEMTAGEMTAGRLADDRLLRYAVERMLTQLVDLAVSINGHVAAASSGGDPRTTASPSSWRRGPLL